MNDVELIYKLHILCLAKFKFFCSWSSGPRPECPVLLSFVYIKRRIHKSHATPRWTYVECARRTIFRHNSLGGQLPFQVKQSQ